MVRTPAGVALAYFHAHVNDETDDCIVWPYARAASGHGRIRIKGISYGVHELACELHYGPRPAGMSAIHGPCHNPACFNWRHLSWGTHHRNMLDRERDGTLPRGNVLPQAKLTRELVIEIRARYAYGDISQEQLAIEYGVTRRTIGRVVSRENWRHVT